MSAGLSNGSAVRTRSREIPFLFVGDHDVNAGWEASGIVGRCDDPAVLREEIVDVADES